MIEPTVGRVVWFWPNRADASALGSDVTQPLAAHVAYVHNSVNFMVIGPTGHPQPRLSVDLVQEGDTASYCEWMPYQVGQAKKNG
jgi:hypothetical protein